jgi:hypothetical protein
VNLVIQTSHLVYKNSQTFLIFFLEKVTINLFEFLLRSSQYFTKNLLVNHYIRTISFLHIFKQFMLLLKREIRLTKNLYNNFPSQRIIERFFLKLRVFLIVPIEKGVRMILSVAKIN